MANKDYYNILGVSKGANQAEIKIAFRKLAHQHHPDKGGDPNKFKELNEAYQVLGNEQKRKQYDQFGSNFNNMGGAGFDFSGFQNGNFSGVNMDFDDMGDLFGGIGDMFGFSSRSGKQRRANREGSNIEAILTIDFREAIFGAEKEILLNKNIKCEKCNGSGAEPGAKVETCPDCKGSGRVFKMQRTIFGSFQAESVCQNCDGEGKTYSKKCSKCNGNGIYKGQEKMKVKIPAGINEGESLRLSGRGNSGIKNSSAGDLILIIKINPDKNFRRKMYDIYDKTTINFKQAILGDKIKIKTVHGDVVLKIPEGTQSGTVFKIKNKGVPKLRGGGNGDHFVEVMVNIPKSLSKKDRTKLEEIEL
ncbi:MAG: molecular chaperone DnaJ [Patescibacteria group bacterium]|jgi:molecular chaperone DnaJ